MKLLIVAVGLLTMLLFGGSVTAQSGEENVSPLANPWVDLTAVGAIAVVVLAVLRGGNTVIKLYEKRFDEISDTHKRELDALMANYSSMIKLQDAMLTNSIRVLSTRLDLILLYMVKSVPESERLDLVAQQEHIKRRDAEQASMMEGVLKVCDECNNLRIEK